MKQYSKERQEIRKYIRKDDLATKKDGDMIWVIFQTLLMVSN